MKNIPDHPEIECALRTGYPSWMQESGDLEEADEFEEPETVYED